MGTRNPRAAPRHAARIRRGRRVSRFRARQLRHWRFYRCGRRPRQELALNEMTTTPRRFELTLLPEPFAISQLVAAASIPEWAMQGAFFSVTRTRDELSIVCEQSRVPAGVRSQPGWSVLKVHGPFDLTETGVLSSLGPLRKRSSACSQFPHLTRIICSLLQRLSQPLSGRLNRRDIRFTGAGKNEKSNAKKCQPPSL